MFRLTALVWLFVVVRSKSAPTDEFRSFIGGELSINDDGLIMGIVPGSYSPQGAQRINSIYFDFLQNNEHYNNFIKYVKKGTILKGLTFNIYDEDMKEAANALLDLIQSAENAGYDGKKILRFDELNTDLVNYVFNLNMLYRDKKIGPVTFDPLFITKPNFFVNSETIYKALKISNNNNYNIDNFDEKQVNQYQRIKNTIIINTNYSGWNLLSNGGGEDLNYFTEDISLNSYYYGIHLMHPYWMLNHKLYSSIPRHDELYYFVHQQLVARYLLENEHLKQGINKWNKTEYSDFNPYLVHENGLPFPLRSNTLGDWSDDRAKIKAIDIAIRECLARGLLVMENADPVKLTGDNFIQLITKLIRANFEVGTTAKIIRSLFGYGGNGHPYNEYNPAPSVLHHPETTLRDPIYWYMIQYALKYFTEYSDTQIDPYDMEDYTTKQFQIVDIDVPKITTYFNYYQFNINRAIRKHDVQEINSLTVTARQKRLSHATFDLSFTVDSLTTTEGIVRLFLGPPCPDDCWDEYSKFFELDKFIYSFKEGINTVTWSPEKSTRFSNDEYYNMEDTVTEKDSKHKYNLFKFPHNLVIPRGLENGMNLTLFIIVTLPDDIKEKMNPTNNLYADLYQHLDNKPLGFPFHMPALADSHYDGPNYKFYNITVYHKRNNISNKGRFSPHLD